MQFLNAIFIWILFNSAIRVRGLRVQMTTQALDIATGEKLILQCLILDAPEETTIFWMFDGDRLEPDSRNDESQGNNNFMSEITVENISKQHAGAYFCIASNEALAESLSAVCYVRVKFAPESRYDRTHKIRILENFPTQIEFQVEAYPEAEIQIFQDDRELRGVYDSRNNSLTLPYMVDALETRATNEVGTTLLPIDYTIVRQISVRSINVEAFETYFTVKIGSESVEDPSSSSNMYLIMLEEYNDARFKMPPIDVDLKGYVSCSNESNAIVNNIVDNIQDSVRTDTPATTTKKLLAHATPAVLTPDTRYLIWIFESDTFICPDNLHWSIWQPMSSSDYIIAKTLPQSETSEESKTYEILWAVIISVGAAILLMILVSITVWMVRRFFRLRHLPKRDGPSELRYVADSQSDHKDSSNNSNNFNALQVDKFENDSLARPQTVISSPRNYPSSPLENVYCIPDEYVVRESAVPRQLSRGGNYDADAYIARIAHPVYIGGGTNSSAYDLSPVKTNQPKNYAPRNNFSSSKFGLNNYGFRSSYDEFYFEKPRKDLMIKPANPSFQVRDFNADDTNVDLIFEQVSSGSSSQTEHASRSSGYYNTSSFAIKPRSNENADSRAHSIYTKNRTFKDVDAPKQRFFPERRSQKPSGLDSRFSPQGSFVSLPDLTAHEQLAARFNSLPRNHEQLMAGKDLRFSPRSNSTNALQTRGEQDEDYFYMQI